MSATAVCGWAAAPFRSDLDVEQRAAAASSSRGAQRLVPVVGLVSRAQEVQVKRSLRWRQRREPSRADDGRQRWRAQLSANGETQIKQKAVSVGESQFEAEVLQSSVPVLVDFWATWCGPCRLMGLTLDWAAQEYNGKIKCVKIETDNNQALVDKYKVYGLPTLILFNNGQPVPNTHREGALNKVKLQKYLEENVPTIASAT